MEVLAAVVSKNLGTLVQLTVNGEGASQRWWYIL